MKTQFDQVADSFHSYLVDGANFTKVEEYPIVPPSFVPAKEPLKVMTFQKAINYAGYLGDTVISFYAPDASFERVRRNPKKYLSFFKKTAGIIGFDFSVHSDMPIVLQKSQMYDNLSLSFYYGAKGVHLYPNIRFGSDCLIDDYLSAFPKNTLISIGTHGFVKLKTQVYEWAFLLKKVIETLHPTGIVVVGPLPNKVLRQFNGTRFYFYDSYLEELKKEGKAYVDKRAK